MRHKNRQVNMRCNVSGPTVRVSVPDSREGGVAEVLGGLAFMALMGATVWLMLAL